ncbi:MAG TPA: hypothetical protein VGN49_05270 [Micrococcaceae bacterium]|nr:hypothetical protein [Micrococcaceae bacterium]
MPRFMIEKVDSSEETLVAAAYREVDGYFHFLDELGDTVLSVCADAVSGIELVKGQDAVPATAQEAESAVPMDAGAVLLIRFWSEPEHDAPLRMRISSTQNLRDEPQITYASSEEQALSVVGGWLERMTGAAQGSHA